MNGHGACQQNPSISKQILEVCGASTNERLDSGTDGVCGDPSQYILTNPSFHSTPEQSSTSAITEEPLSTPRAFHPAMKSLEKFLALGVESATSPPGFFNFRESTSICEAMLSELALSLQAICPDTILAGRMPRLYVESL